LKKRNILLNGVDSRVADSYLHYFVQLDPDLHQGQNSRAIEAQNVAIGPRALEAHNGGAEASNGVVEGLYTSGRRFASLWWWAGSDFTSKWKVESGSGHQSEKRDPDPGIKVKRGVRIRKPGW
jgi:hypothetical protein